MADPITVIIRFTGDPDDLLERFEKARRSWIQAQDGDHERPLFYAACKTDDGIAIVNAWKTAAENVEAALAPLRISRHERRQTVERHLDAVGLGPRAQHLPTQLSGGEQQRVAIARALARSPRVVLADEPTGNLDTSNGAMVMDLLARLHRELEITLVLVTHDEWIAERADRVLRLADGRLITDSGGPVAEELAQ